MGWLHRYLLFLVASTVLLLVAGGAVTSTGSGLSVPDWPNSYGYFMFSFPLRYMVGGIFYEHGHRLIASTVGLLTIGLVVWLYLQEPRRWVRRLGVVALVAVVLQGTLGGITVVFFLPAPISIAHAGLAQIFFCLVVSLAVFTSRGWIEAYRGDRTSAALDDEILRNIAVATTVLVYCQILLGATMRHTGAGLAIPDFPWAFGHVLPPDWSWPVAIHFSHRVGALVVSLMVLATAGHIWYHHRQRAELTRPVLLLILLVFVQGTLGALTVLSERDVVINTAHVAVGALVLATSLVVTLRAWRNRFADVADDVALTASAPSVHGRHWSAGARI
jgi:cytochrome c oxidase assembly protein subunit 15